MVSGLRVDLTLEEDEAVRAEWAANDVIAAEERAVLELERKKAAATHALEERSLAEALTDPDAPQEVKDYAVAIEAKADSTV
jgi:hypothetical protein